MKLRVAKSINPAWGEYDSVVAANQLESFGVIFLDEFYYPIDNEYDLEELYSKYTEYNVEKLYDQYKVENII